MIANYKVGEGGEARAVQDLAHVGSLLRAAVRFLGGVDRAMYLARAADPPPADEAPQRRGL